MMSNSSTFSYPPPPPPPPRPTSNDADSRAPNGFSNQRGRGHSNGSHRVSPPRGGSRGRGFDGGRGSSGYPAKRPSFDTTSTRPSYSQPTHSSQVQKRSYGVAFSQKPQPRPQASPAVPSFNAGLEHLLSSKPTPSTTTTNVPQSARKSNLLGLTPAQAETSDSEDDQDEETRLASATQGIQIEYKGSVSTLRTPAEVAAWIAERRKRYPTQAKREAAQKDAQERKKRYEEEKRIKQERIQKEREEHNKQRQTEKPQPHTVRRHAANSSTRDTSDANAPAKLRADKLRRKLEKAERDLAIAEAAVSASQTNNGPELPKVQGDESKMHAVNPASDSSGFSDVDATSSSGSDSDSDSDAAPEEMSSKAEIHLRHPSVTDQATCERVCSFFARSGQCKFGKKCRYAHVRQETVKRERKLVKPSSTPSRKGLWQVMMEREQEEEQKKVVRAIIALGDAGILDEPKP